MELTNLDLDIVTGIKVSAFVLFGIAVFVIFGGISMIRNAGNTRYFRRKKIQIASGWRRIIFALMIAGFGFIVFQFGEPLAVTYFPMTSTPTLAPTIGNTPTRTLLASLTPTPTITETPSESHTPTMTPTPFLPVAVEAQFTSQVTPGNNIIFSELTFSREISENFEPIDASDTFSNPLTEIYALFTYDGMNPGVQWTALWFRDGELVFYESFPWADSTGGYGYTNWVPIDPFDWQPGYYQVQIFVGSNWVVVGSFDVEGLPPTATISITPTATISETPSRTHTRTPWPTLTRTITRTPWPTATPETPTMSPTPWPTLTRTITPTPWPTQTQTPTWTSPLNNVALYKQAKGSNSLFDFPPSKAVDGNENTKWDSGNYPSQWFEIDLGSIHELSEFRLQIAQWPQGETTHILQVKTAIGDEYTTIHEFTGITKDFDWLIFAPGNALEDIRYIRIQTTESPSWAAWRDIVVNGQEMQP